MLTVYEELRKEKGTNEDADYDACMIISEASAQKYTPAMIRLACEEMCQDDEFWPEGLNLLYEAWQLGDDNAWLQLKNAWHNCVRDWESCKYLRESEINEYHQYAIGFCYLRGVGVEKNETKGRLYIEKSAKRGCREAKELLRTMS